MSDQPVKLHPRCLGAERSEKPCVRAQGEMAIDTNDRCAGCGVSWWLANPAGTKRTPEHLRSDLVN